MKTLTKMKKVCCFNRFVLFAMALSLVTTFTACSSDDDDSNIPVYSLKDVDGNYSGKMLTEPFVTTLESIGEGEEPAGVDATAEVKDNQIMIKKLPLDDLIKSIVNDDEIAAGIIEKLGDINYNIPYTPTFDESKANILLQLKPEPLELKLVNDPAPTQVEEGEEPSNEIIIKVTIEADKNGTYVYEGKKLAFIIKATKVDVAGTEFPFTATTFIFDMAKK